LLAQSAIVGPPSLGVLLNTYAGLSDFTQVICITIVFLILGIVVGMIFSKADLAMRRRRGVLDSSSTS
jgi:hypothetical protein